MQPGLQAGDVQPWHVRHPIRARPPSQPSRRRPPSAGSVPRCSPAGPWAASVAGADDGRDSREDRSRRWRPRWNRRSPRRRARRGARGPDFYGIQELLSGRAASAAQIRRVPRDRGAVRAPTSTGSARESPRHLVPDSRSWACSVTRSPRPARFENSGVYRGWVAMEISGWTRRPRRHRRAHRAGDDLDRRRRLGGAAGRTGCRGWPAAS